MFSCTKTLTWQSKSRYFNSSAKNPPANIDPASQFPRNPWKFHFKGKHRQDFKCYKSCSIARRNLYHFSFNISKIFIVDLSWQWWPWGILIPGDDNDNDESSRHCNHNSMPENIFTTAKQSSVFLFLYDLEQTGGCKLKSSEISRN